MRARMKAVQVHQQGGPEMLRLVEMDLPEPGAGQVRIRIEAAGVNYLDIYQRAGIEAVPLPRTLGVEAVGIVDAIGPGIDTAECIAGSRVVYTSLPGAYAEYAVVPWDRVISLPADLDPHVALAAMLQGLTAHYLTHDTYPIRTDDVVMVHAAAGGTGSQIVQMARGRGARVLAIVSTDEKEAGARRSGASEVIVSSLTGIAATARELTGGLGVDVVYDSVGRATFSASIESLKRRGMMVLFGQSSGAVEPCDPLLLKSRGSLYLTRPSLADYIATRPELVRRADAVFSALRSGDLRPRIDRALPLGQAIEAHRRLEGRQSQGKILLIP